MMSISYPVFVPLEQRSSVCSSIYLVPRVLRDSSSTLASLASGWSPGETIDNLVPFLYLESSFIIARKLLPRVLRLFGQRVGARRIRKKLNFLVGCPVTVCIVLPQKSCGNKIPVPHSPGDKPLAKEPKDSGYEVAVRSCAQL